MTVLREWRAGIRRELKTEYVSYVLRTGIAHYRATRLKRLLLARAIESREELECCREAVKAKSVLVAGGTSVFICGGRDGWQR